MHAHTPQCLKERLNSDVHSKHSHRQMCIYMYVPGSLSSIVMSVVLGEPIVARSVWLVEVITTMKYSVSSVVLSSMVDTIKVAYI